jgi:predicted amidohydrolase YtcJ
VVDLGGKIVAPGLTDSICHILMIGEREMGLKIEGTNSLDDFSPRSKSGSLKLSTANGSPVVDGSNVLETAAFPGTTAARSNRARQSGLPHPS